MAPVEALGEAQDRRQRADCRPAFPAEVAVLGMAPLGRRLPVVARDQPDDLDLIRIEAPQIPILDQIVGMLVVALIADVYADIMQ
jgi:hypothetical protein